MNITLNTPESAQESNFQNATLHTVTEKIACSIAITPNYPEHVKTQAQAEEYLAEFFRTLDSHGWEIDVQMGLSRDYEDYNNPDMFDGMDKAEVFELLKSNAEVKTSMTDYWCENNGQCWEDFEIVKLTSDIFNVEIKTDTKPFEFIKEFVNQQLMFELVGYKDDAAYQNCKGETLTCDPFIFLFDLKFEALLMTGLFDDHEFIKVRSSDGNFSELTSDIVELNDVEL